MNNQFQLSEPEDAETLLATLPTAARRSGEELFQKGQVLNLKCDEPGISYSADVPEGGSTYKVTVFYLAEDGWDAMCSCNPHIGCKHTYLVLKSLLVEHTAACVHILSAGSRPVKPMPKDQPKQSPGPTINLSKMLSAAVERPLLREETFFLRNLSELYQRCCATRTISSWDLSELGLSLVNSGWGDLKIWPSFPRDEHEFWLYIANAALEQKRPIPPFMEPVTDLSVVSDELGRWKRAREVDRWRKTMENTRNGRMATSKSQGQIDLQVKFHIKHASLEWKRPNAGQFEPMKQSQSRQLDCDYTAERVHLTPEAEIIWGSFEDSYNGNLMQLMYDDAESKRTLARLLRLRSLNDRIVNEQGQPFLRATEPLRWAMTPAQHEHDSYRLRLVRADNTPLPRDIVVLPGNPPFYVTDTTIFTGPPIDDKVLSPRDENVIPAAAIESRIGVEFINQLGVELPPRLQNRVRRVPWRIKISCSLQERYPGSKTECCHVKVIAQTEDNMLEEMWTGSFWEDTARPKSTKKVKDREPFFTVYDRSVLEEVAGLMTPLDLKWEGYNETLSMRVTKKLPDIFVPWLKSLPPHIEVQLDGDLASLALDPVAAQLKLDVTEVSVDWFDLLVVLNVSDTELTSEELKLLLDAKGRYVRLETKGWRRLEFNLDAEEDERLARLGLNPRELSSEPQRLHALQLADQAAARFLPEEQVAQIQRRACEIKASVTPEVPAQVRAELRPYQLEGFHFLAYLSANRFGGILADDMGLGKTVQTLTWLAWLREQNATGGQPAADGIASAMSAQPIEEGQTTSQARLSRCKPSLVVCPKSVMDIWRSEAERFTPDLRVKVWPAGEVDTLLDHLQDADLHVLNYTQLRLVGESLAPAAWLAVILDEGQYIKNPSSQTAQVARALRADYRLALSGTPIENRLLDLWSLMAFAMPGVLGSRAQFAQLYDQKGDPFARRRLAARVRPFLLRRTKTQVAKDLPDRIEEDLLCEIEGEQKALYRAELKRAQQLLLRVTTQHQLAKERFHVLTSLLRLRQICCHPALVNPESKAESAKVNALLEQLEPLMEEGNKVLVFSQFVTMLDLLRPPLTERGWPIFYLAGNTENRGELVQQFQSVKGEAVFLISLKAGGFGLNLTAASYVVLFDPWWNPAVENQAIDRTHRIGQTSKVIAYRLLIKDSIEGKIRALQKQKSAIAQDVFGEEKFSQALTLEDLHYLFAD